jgi:hypothetical protein
LTLKIPHPLYPEIYPVKNFLQAAGSRGSTAGTAGIFNAAGTGFFYTFFAARVARFFAARVAHSH